MDIVITSDQYDHILSLAIKRGLDIDAPAPGTMPPGQRSLTFDAAHKRVLIHGSVADAVCVITYLAMAATQYPHEERAVIRFLADNATLGGALQIINKVVVRDE